MGVVDRVQTIASQSTILDATIPTEFILPDQERPDLTTYHGPIPTSLPVIDLSDSDHNRIVDDITRAAKEWGIFQVVNRGIPFDTVEELQKVGKEFFELPLEEKELYASEPGSTEGYGSQFLKGAEGRKEWVDYLFHNIWPASKVNYKYWPKNPPAYREANEEYAKYLVGVLDELLRCLSLGLGLEEGVLKEASGGEDLEFLLKINYYPPCPRPDLALGVTEHTDMSAITILVPNEVPGLQVFKDDHWFDAEYIPNAFIIHIGDQIEILSNGKYKSVLHRSVVNKEKTRMSWPVFCSPPPEKIVGPLPQLVSDENPAKFRTKKYEDYQYCKRNKLPQ